MKLLVTAGWDHAPHLAEAVKKRLLESYPAHERDARTKGEPLLGSGKVFPVDEETIKIHPFPIPSHFVRINGLDFGWDHPNAAASIAWDRDADCIYVMREYRQKEVTPIIVAGAIKPWGQWIPIAWPHDGLQHDKGSGEQLAQLYRKQDLKMLPARATHPAAPGEIEGTGGNSVEAGITEMLDRMLTGRWKVFSTCQLWFQEFRLYHRKDGIIVKMNDDLISASRYAMMMKRFAKMKQPDAQQRVLAHETHDIGIGL